MKYNNFNGIYHWLMYEVENNPDFVTKETHEKLNMNFCLTVPTDNKCPGRNYEYAEEFFKWMMTGEKFLSDEIIKLAPHAQRYVSSKHLPENFSASYGWKIKEQLPAAMKELENPDSRRAYLNILIPEDDIILATKSTHEYPCNIGVQLLIRDNKLHMIANYRSNNIYNVLPYDVYNLTRLQMVIAKQLEIDLGYYYHSMNSAHIFNKHLKF